VFIEFIFINPKIPRIINKVEQKVSRWVREKSCEIKMGFWDGTLIKVPPLDAVRLTTGQTLYRLMNNRLGTLQMMWSTNPGSEGLTDHSSRWLMLHHSRTCLSQRSSSGDERFVLHGLTPPKGNYERKNIYV